MIVQSPQRLLFLDNLRYLIVLFVMLFHVSAGYSGWPEYYHETQAGGFFAIMHGIITSIRRMPLLFFIAGYFAMPSLVGRGGVSVCKHRQFLQTHGYKAGGAVGAVHFSGRAAIPISGRPL